MKFNEHLLVVLFNMQLSWFNNNKNANLHISLKKITSEVTSILQAFYNNNIIDSYEIRSNASFYVY